MAARALLALPELDDEDATRAARHGSDAVVAVRTKHNRVACVDKSGLVAGVAHELSSVEIVARPCEHDIYCVNAARVYVFLVPQSSTRRHRVVLDDSRLEDSSRTEITEMCHVGCASRGSRRPARVTALAVGKQLPFARAMLAHDEAGEQAFVD